MDRFRSTVGPQDTNVPRLLSSCGVDFYMSRFWTLRVSGLKHATAPGEGLPVDPGSLRQVFSNLLLNAAHAMPGEEECMSECPGHRVDRTREAWLQVTFADNGCGISAEDLPKVTEPFFTTKGSAGTGLGLALVKDMVEKHLLVSCE